MVRLLQLSRQPKAAHPLVSIPQWCDCCFPTRKPQATPIPRFNPTMVRLLRAKYLLSRLQQSVFQSHNGAIAAYRAVTMFAHWQGCFNPTMVRLLPSAPAAAASLMICFNPTMVRLLLKELFANVPTSAVSIPQWCDCCLLKLPKLAKLRKCFNPTMVRLLQVREGY